MTRQRIGIGLWTMQSTAAVPASLPGLYRAFAEDALIVEELGFHSVWTAEHRSWYDGWCPTLMHAQAFVAARTERVRFGNAMLLLPQHDPVRLARTVAALDTLSGGRVELGAGLGYRDAEYDMLGLRRDRRGRLMDDALDTLAQVWSAETGDCRLIQRPAPPIWIGGMAPAAISRAARRGFGLMLPQTLMPDELATIADAYRAEADRPGPVGALRDIWIEPDDRRSREVADRINRHYREEAGSWWTLKGKVGFAAPDQMDRQLARIRQSAMMGSAEQVAEGLAALVTAGADFLTLRVNFDVVERAELHEQLRRLSDEVVPLLPPIGGAT